MHNLSRFSATFIPAAAAGGGGRNCVFISVMSREALELCKRDVLPSPICPAHRLTGTWPFALLLSPSLRNAKRTSVGSWTGPVVAAARVACCHGETDALKGQDGSRGDGGEDEDIRRSQIPSWSRTLSEDERRK